MKNTWNGKQDNHDTRRPPVGMIVTTGTSRQEYKLVNILVNGGRYDTYVLQNVRTGKQKKALVISQAHKTRPAFSAAELWGLIQDQKTSTARRFRELITIAENQQASQEERNAAYRQLLSNAICDNHQDKMEDMLSMSTSCRVSCADNLMREDQDCICSACFSDSQQERQPGTEEKLIRNTYLLAFHEIPQEAFPLLNVLDFRLESFGDLMNACQFENYLKLVKKNPRVRFAEWTKKPWIMSHVFQSQEKPENLVLILSAPKINDTLTFAEARNAWSFIDKLFTVYTKDYAEANAININCGARHCFTCLNCYEFNDVHHVRELLK